jgi:hypothetical protein
MNDDIKAKIVELVPDVLEVKFGCTFELVGYSRFQAELFKRFGTKYFVYDGQSRLLCEHGSLEFNDMYLPHRDKWIIVGAPITLAVVLRAMFVHTNGKSEHAIRDTEFTEVMWRWKWANDNYDQQSDECKHFIGLLLGIIN